MPFACTVSYGVAPGLMAYVLGLSPVTASALYRSNVAPFTGSPRSSTFCTNRRFCTFVRWITVENCLFVDWYSTIEVFSVVASARDDAVVW